jgi:hypothetical protein
VLILAGTSNNIHSFLRDLRETRQRFDSVGTELKRKEITIKDLTQRLEASEGCKYSKTFHFHRNHFFFLHFFYFVEFQLSIHMTFTIFIFVIFYFTPIYGFLSYNYT